MLVTVEFTALNSIETKTESFRSIAISICVSIFVLGILIFLTITAIVMNKYLQKVFEKKQVEERSSEKLQ